MVERRKFGIPTYYNGIEFRSRLEVRWVIFFNELDIRWEYEPKTFAFTHPDNGFPIWYKPDFYLPGLGVWAEVKPTELEPLEDLKCRLLCAETHRPILTLIDVPSSDRFTAYVVDWDKMAVAYRKGRWNINGKRFNPARVERAVLKSQNYRFVDQDFMYETEIEFVP